MMCINAENKWLNGLTIKNGFFGIKGGFLGLKRIFWQFKTDFSF